MKPNALRISAVVSMMALLSGCLDFSMSKTTSTSGSSSSNSLSGASFTPVAMNQFVGSAGVKNVNQLLSSLAAVTNMSVSTLAASTGGGTTTIGAQYSTISPFLSPDGTYTSINSAMMLSLTGLIGQVCSVFIGNEAANPNVLKNAGITFSSGASQFGGSAAVNTTVVNALAQQFWGRAPTAAELATLTQAMASAATTVPGTGSAATQNLLIVPCTVMLASPEFLSA
jgi:hypothetical protein